MGQKKRLREEAVTLAYPTSNKGNVNASMEGFQDIFCNNAFAGSVNGKGNSRNSGSINISSNSFIFQPFGEDGLATNLTESNNGVARQSNLIEEVIEQQQRQPDMYRRNFFNCDSNFSSSCNPNKPKVFVPDNLVTDLSRRVNSLSLTERQQAQNDMCGFRLRQPKEDPLEVSMWMNEMDVLIEKGISGSDKRFSALRLAMYSHGHSNGNSSDNNSGAEYVRSQKLIFLRSADWSVEAAVFRMAVFFELKLEHFGSESLIRDLTTNDLSMEELEVWKRAGFMQMSKERDAYGRRIICYFGKLFRHISIVTLVKCIVCFTTIMARDVSIQLDGVALVFWGIGHNISTLSRARQFILTFKAVPMRLVARHVCYNSDAVKDMFPLTAQLAQTWGIIRFVIHKGPAMECFYNLMTYGIPRTAIPISNDGVIDMDFHLIFTQEIRLKEADDEKRIRQERLDQQIQQFQVQNQISYINTIDNSRGSQGMQDRMGEPYQRQPSIMPIEERYNESERSDVLSWNMSGLSGLEPLSLPSDDSVRRLAEPNNSAMGSTISNIGTTSSTPPDNSASRYPRQTECLTKESIFVPGLLDVIMGRGRHNKNKPGNQKLNQLLESYLDEYEASDKFQKTVLSEVVVSEMKEGGSRFLIREKRKTLETWVEVSLEKARDKVAHDFRNLRRSAKIAKNIADGAASTHQNEIGAPKRQRSLTNGVKLHDDSKAKKPSSMRI